MDCPGGRCGAWNCDSRKDTHLRLREPCGFEFGGVGPNLLLGGEKGVNTALVIAAGKTFDFRGVSFPINLAVVTSPSGTRIGFIVGYAIQKSEEQN